MRIVCVNYEPVTLYRDIGWSCERLGHYYNPNSVAEEVIVLAYEDRDWQVSPTVAVSGFRSFGELQRKCGVFRPDIIRCYEAFRPFCDYALMLAVNLGIPSYLSLHDQRAQYYRRLAGFAAITAYTETLAEKASRQLGREVETQLNGVDSKVFGPKSPEFIDQRVALARYRIFTVGRDDPVKNVSTAVEATRILSRRLDSVAHVIAGPGTERIAFDGIHLGLGALTDEMVVNYLNWCSCFLQVQLVSDIGMAATEALMVGRPVVVSGDPGGNAKYLIDESRGILIPLEKAKDAQFTADVLQKCLDGPYDCERIRKWAVEVFDAGKLRRIEAERYLKLAASVRKRPTATYGEMLGRRLGLISMEVELAAWQLLFTLRSIVCAVTSRMRHLRRYPV